MKVKNRGGMTDMTHGERAEANFRKGYNCAQAVYLAWAEEIGLTEEQAARTVCALGGGMGRLREVCGAVSGALMVLGALEGYSDPKDQGAKAYLYALEQRFAAKFRAQNGTIICRELLGLSTGPSAPTPEVRTEAYYEKRPCSQLCRQAADLLDELLGETEAEFERRQESIEEEINWNTKQ